MMLVHLSILRSIKSLKHTGVATMYHGFQYTGSGFSEFQVLLFLFLPGTTEVFYISRYAVCNTDVLYGK